MHELRWLWFAPLAFAVLRIVGNQFVEGAVDQMDFPPAFAASIVTNAETFSIGMYFVGMSGLAFLLFTWLLRKRLEQAPDRGWVDMGFASGIMWGILNLTGAVLAATAPVLAGSYNDAEGARLVTNLELSTTPLALTLLGAFALGNGLALRRYASFSSWLAWTGIFLGGLLVLTAGLQPIVEPTARRSTEEVDNVVTAITGLAFFGLVPLWTIATGVTLFRREGRQVEGAETR